MSESTHSTEYHRLCTVLIQARKTAGLTQQQLADELERPQSFVSKYERGQRRLDVVEMIEIAETLDANPYHLIDEVLDARS